MAQISGPIKTMDERDIPSLLALHKLTTDRKNGKQMLKTTSRVRGREQN